MDNFNMDVSERGCKDVDKLTQAGTMTTTVNFIHALISWERISFYIRTLFSGVKKHDCHLFTKINFDDLWRW